MNDPICSPTACQDVLLVTTVNMSPGGMPGSFEEYRSAV